MRRQGRLLAFAAALIVVGFLGIVASAWLVGGRGALGSGTRGDRTGRPTRFSSTGERIFYTGVGRSGPIPREWSPPSGFGGMMGGSSMMSRSGCVVCHRPDGRGGRITMMWTAIDVPDITYSTLTSEHREETTTTPGWTREQIEDAIRKGVEPDGGRLDPFMPRWKMSDSDMADTIDYLKELDER